MTALTELLAATDGNRVREASLCVAEGFNGLGEGFIPIADNTGGAEKKLVESFHNNLVLLIQKTWVEKSDEDLKAQVLYHLEECIQQMNGKAYGPAFDSFLSIVDTVVYLMFGAQTKSKDFAEYALRIDPEFGIFWWYMQSLPQKNDWSEVKRRIAILLGMYFLANY